MKSSHRFHIHRSVLMGSWEKGKELCRITELLWKFKIMVFSDSCPSPPSPQGQLCRQMRAVSEVQPFVWMPAFFSRDVTTSGMLRVCGIILWWVVPFSRELETWLGSHCSLVTSLFKGKHSSSVNLGGSFFGSSSFQLCWQHLPSDPVVSLT